MSFMSVENDVTTIVVNYRTPHLLPVVTDSFKRFYPDVRLVLIDNGSEDSSGSEISKLQKKHRAVDSILLNRNVSPPRS